MRPQNNRSTITPRPGLADIVTGILQDARTLMRQEVQLLRDEVKLEISKAGRAASGMGLGLGLSAVGGLFLLFMLVYGLHEWIGLPLWASYGIIGGLSAGAGGIMLVRGRSLAGNVNTMPRRTMFAIKEDAQWIKEHVMSKKT